MLEAKHIQKSYGSMTVLADVSFSLTRGQKVALVGDNGVGKTTLLKIIAGLEEADSGEVNISSSAQIGYLPQDTSLVEKEPIREYLRRVVGIDRLEQRLNELSENLDDESNFHEYGELHEQYERLNGYAFEHRMHVMLSGFGLEDISLQHDLQNLSSGQKSKIVLAGILLKGVDLLLLDEPTNNLDLPALIWLEDFLRKSEAACITISHDRRFLDRVVKKIFEIDRNTRTLNISGGTYSDYLEMVEKRIAKQKEAHRLQQEEISRLTEQARSQKARASKGAGYVGSDNDKFARGFKRDRASGSAKKAKAIEKRIDQMEKVEKPIERDPFEIPLEAEVVSGTLDVRMSDVVAGYPDGFSVGPLSLEIRFKNRVGILGLNGSGKSTILKTITGQLEPLAGSVEIGSGVRFGNMMQEHETLPRDKTLLDFLKERAGLSQEMSYAKLAKFGFDQRQAKHHIGTLSPGGRARLLLALFSAQSVNMLILDEPTNHLDLQALEALEETLQGYSGTVLLVSHDRYFIEKAGLDTFYLLSDRSLTRIPDYTTYVKEAEDRAQQLIKAL